MRPNKQASRRTIPAANRDDFSTNAMISNKPENAENEHKREKNGSKELVS